MNNSLKVRQITEGAIITALYCLIFFLSRFAGGGLEYDLFFLLPLPLALFSYKYNYKVGLIPFVSTLLISIFACLTPYHSLVFVLPGLLIGLIFGGLLIKSKIKSIYQILLIILMCVIMETLSLLALSKILGVEDIYSEIDGISNAIVKIFNLDYDFIRSLLKGLIPSLILVIALIEGILIYLIFMVVINKLKMLKLPEKPIDINFRKAPIPLSIIYSILLIIFLSLGWNLFSSNEGIRITLICLLNIVIVLSIVYIYFGMKTATLYFGVNNKKWGIIIIFVFMLVPPLQIGLIILGLIDSFISISDRLLSKTK